MSKTTLRFAGLVAALTLCILAQLPSSASAAACTLPACNTVLEECNRPPSCSIVSETVVGTCTEDGGQHFKMLITCTCLRGTFCTN
jgi:hypothetical protein